MCIRDRLEGDLAQTARHHGRLADHEHAAGVAVKTVFDDGDVDVQDVAVPEPVSYTHLRAHETVLDLVCRLLLEKNNRLHT